jgi:hypothetical protein
MKALLVLLVFFPLHAFSYYTFQDTGDLLQPGKYAVGTELQFITEDDSGVNILGRFDGGWRDGWNYRAIVGLGEVDFQVGGFVKWVPIPDHGKQPAIGISAGGLLASYADDTEISARVYPFISKDFMIESGKLTPYATLPLGVRTFDGDSSSTAQAILGGRFNANEMKGADFFAEVGLDLDDAPTFFGIGATFPLNDENLIDLWPGD